MASWSRVSYHRRLFLWLLGYSLLLVGCFVTFQYVREKQFKAEELNSRLQLINTYILSELAEGNPPADIHLTDFHPFEDIRVSVISDSGRVVYDNSIDSLPGASHLDREEIRMALASGVGYTVRRHSQSTGSTYFYSATRGHDGTVVRTAVSYSLSLSSLLRADYNFIWIMGTIALVMCTLGYFATRRLGQHITRLSRFARRVENGERISDSDPFPNDELGAVANHIVRLYGRLQQAIADRDAEHRATMHEQREKERIKKQLTNNINHELKTPIASIRVCLETLLSHPELTEEKRALFLQRSLANTERLQRMLTDVALITRMDDGRTSIALEQVDLSDIIASVADDRRIIADSKSITIADHVKGPLPMTGSAALLEAVFNNLLDNAISYSGGTEVHIREVHADDNTIEITVTDNGTGVAAEHLPRLFERFYRIDKGRSRAAGGTGLGLAIVKNAVMLHGGSVAASNIPSGGLQIRVTLQRKRIS